MTDPTHLDRWTQSTQPGWLLRTRRQRFEPSRSTSAISSLQTRPWASPAGRMATRGTTPHGVFAEATIASSAPRLGITSRRLIPRSWLASAKRIAAIAAATLNASTHAVVNACKSAMSCGSAGSWQSARPATDRGLFRKSCTGFGLPSADPAAAQVWFGLLRQSSSGIGVETLTSTMLIECIAPASFGGGSTCAAQACAGITTRKLGGARRWNVAIT